MSRVFQKRNSSCAWNSNQVSSVIKKRRVFCEQYSSKEEDVFHNFHGKVEVSFIAKIFFLCLAVSFFGALYLYEINALATKGHEIKEAEKKIQNLREESKKLKIKEVELKSMYTIEKSMPELRLVSSSRVLYIEMDGPMAMK